MSLGQDFADFDAGGSIAQVEIDKRDFSFAGVTQRALLVSSDADRLMAHFRDDLLDLGSDEYLVFNNENATRHQTTVF